MPKKAGDLVPGSSGAKFGIKVEMIIHIYVESNKEINKCGNVMPCNKYDYWEYLISKVLITLPGLPETTEPAGML